MRGAAPSATPSGPAGAVLGVAPDLPEAVAIRTINEGLQVALYREGGEIIDLVPARIDLKATIASKRQGGTLARIGVATGPVAIDALFRSFTTPPTGFPNWVRIACSVSESV
mgnify:CR=1 FL=1